MLRIEIDFKFTTFKFFFHVTTELFLAIFWSSTLLLEPGEKIFELEIYYRKQ